MDSHRKNNIAVAVLVCLILGVLLALWLTVSYVLSPTDNAGAVVGVNVTSGTSVVSDPTQPIVVDIKATIDGTDVVQFYDARATWLHVAYGRASNVTINGAPWNTGLPPLRRLPSLADADWPTAKVISQSGRDMVALDMTDGPRIYFDDTEPGAAQYEIKISMKRKSVEANPATAPATHSSPIFFNVQGEIDGTDELMITPAGLKWMHRSMNMPVHVMVNWKEWDIGKQMTIEEAGLANADLSSALAVKREGRGLMALEKIDNGVVIYFSDAADGAGEYHMKVRFEGK